MHIIMHLVLVPYHPNYEHLPVSITFISLMYTLHMLSHIQSAHIVVEYLLLMVVLPARSYSMFACTPPTQMHAC